MISINSSPVEEKSYYQPAPFETGNGKSGTTREGILFLTLKVFSVTGGIEKVGRVAGKALFEIGEDWQQNFEVLSMHDGEHAHRDNLYFPSKSFKGFNANKLKFIYAGIKCGIKSRIVVLSHINLLLVGYIIKLLSPNTKVILIAHGIEVWRPLAGWKKKMLTRTDLILPISRFTKEKMKAIYHLKEEKFKVLNNSLDPLLASASSCQEITALRHKYGFSTDNFIVLTLSRLSGTEQGKGYDKILFALAELINRYPQLRYVFVGKYDKAEKTRLDELIAELGLVGFVVFAGFVPDADVALHYGMADVYVMPSEKEGFGISFIEALYYGVPVIAGNRDGTTDALCDGNLGTLVDPRSQQEITNAIKKVIEDKKAFKPNRELLLKKFSYNVYKNNLQNILAQLN